MHPDDPPPAHTFRVFVKNVNTLSLRDDAAAWRGAATALTKYKVNLFCFQETNIAWDTPQERIATSALRHFQTRPTIATSISSEPGATHGGTAIGTWGAWSGRVIAKGQDPSGLGRWSYITMIGKGQVKNTFVSAYRVCLQRPDSSRDTAYAQQYRLLLLKGIQQPNPRQQFFDDLTLQLTEWRQDPEHGVFIGIDANESLRTGKHFQRFLQQNQLVDIITQVHGSQHETPDTYHRGSKTIDYGLCTKGRMLNSVLAACYFPYDTPPLLKGDHRTQGYDFDAQLLFGLKCTEEIHLPARHIDSKNIVRRHKFCLAVVTQCREQQLFERLQQLNQVEQFDESDHKKLEDIDQTFTQILLQAEKQCGTTCQIPWSPALHQMWLRRTYWMCKLKAVKNKRDYHTQLHDLATQIQGPPQSPQASPGILSQLRYAQNQYRALRKQARALRDEFLAQQINDAEFLNKPEKAKRIRAIKRAEQKNQYHQVIRGYTKPRQQGGLRYILAPTPNNPSQWTTVTDVDDMEKAVIAEAQIHFGQAHGTPFTIEPLSSLTGYDGLSPFCHQIYQGAPEIIDALQVDVYTKLILQFCRRTNEASSELNQAITPAAVTKGFLLWRERTSTSPSGLHLGLYRALAKSTASVFLNPDQTDKKEDDKAAKDRHPIKSGQDVMEIVATLLTLAIRHCHVYKRWRTIHNFCLPKDSEPKVTRLRTIHLMEADYNLVLKWYAAKQLMHHAENNHQLPDEQGGGRRDRAAIDGALAKVLAYDIIRMRRLSAINIDNDAKACYDRIIEPLSNMTMRRHGAPIDILRLHAQTHKSMRYHVKHHRGISTDSNGWSPTTPWYGSGQGAGDSPARWVVITDTMIKAYNTQAKPWKVCRSNGTVSHELSVFAYVDDTTILVALEEDTPLETLMQAAQHNLTTWHGLLHSTGGALNPDKSCWSLFQWEYNHHGNATLQNPGTTSPITLSNPNGVTKPLRQTTTSEAVRLLGVHITMDGNYDKELQVLHQRCQTYINMLKAYPMDRNCARIAYHLHFYPTVSYPLAATHMSQTDLNQAQKPVTHAFLSALGFNPNMPRSIVYAPPSFGGIGLRDLYVEQGIAQTMALIRHTRASTTLGKTLHVLIETFQLVAGLSQPILTDTRPISYANNKWLESLRGFLRYTQSSIHLKDAWTIPAQRINDRHIMDIMTNYSGNSDTDLQLLNNCRMFMRVTTLSEICDHSGQRMLPEALDGTINPDTQQPTLWTYQQPNLYWPKQQQPGPHAWKLWRARLTLLLGYTDQSPKLQRQHHLGPWFPTPQHPATKWQYYYSPLRTQQLYQKQGNIWHSARRTHANRRQLIFANLTPTEDHELPMDATPVHPQRVNNTLILSLPIAHWCPTTDPSESDRTTQRTAKPKIVWPKNTYIYSVASESLYRSISQTQWAEHPLIHRSHSNQHKFQLSFTTTMQQPPLPMAPLYATETENHIEVSIPSCLLAGTGNSEHQQNNSAASPPPGNQSFYEHVTARLPPWANRLLRIYMPMHYNPTNTAQTLDTIQNQSPTVHITSHSYRKSTDRSHAFYWRITGIQGHSWHGWGNDPDPNNRQHHLTVMTGFLVATLWLEQWIQFYHKKDHLPQVCLLTGSDKTASNLLLQTYKGQLSSRLTITNSYELTSTTAQQLRQLSQYGFQFYATLPEASPLKANPKTAQDYKTLVNALPPEATECIIPSAAMSNLNIQGHSVQKNYGNKLRDAALTPAYRHYLKDKFQWTDNALDDIQWEALGRAML